MNIIAFVPCRSGSERVPMKNTKDFGGISGGLLKIKLTQLLKVPLINTIVLSTNDEEVIKIATALDKRIVIDKRPENLATSATSTDELINYVPEIIHEGHVLWTHVTSPFLDEQVYQKAIQTYKKNLEEGIYDSLMTVNKIQTFLWNRKGSVNYDRNEEKWPRTQTLPELFEVNSGMFINTIENYRKFNDRIGKTPFLFETEGFNSFDIDWPDDFELGQLIYEKIHG